MLSRNASPHEIAVAAEAAIERGREMAERYCDSTEAEKSLMRRGIVLKTKGPNLHMVYDRLTLAVVVTVEYLNYVALDLEEGAMTAHTMYEDAFNAAAQIACRVFDEWLEDMKKEARRG